MLTPGVKSINALATSGTCLLAGTSSGLMELPGLSSDAVPIQVDALHMQVRSLLPVVGSIYAGMHGGIAVSEDQGETWTNLNHDQPFNVVTSLAVGDKHLFLGTFGEAVWRLPREDAVPTRVPAPGTRARRIGCRGLARGRLLPPVHRRREEPRPSLRPEKIGWPAKNPIALSDMDELIVGGKGGLPWIGACRSFIAT